MTINNYDIHYGFCWQNLPGKETKLSIRLRITTIVLGSLIAIAGISIGLLRIETIGGFSAFSAGIILITLGTMIKQTKQKKIFENILQFASRVLSPVSSTMFPSHSDVIVDLPSSANPQAHTSNPEILVFQGGGPKIYAYIGALQALEETNIPAHVKIVSGTSAGAIFATCIALGYTSSEIKNFLKKWEQINYHDRDSEDFNKWIRSIIKQKTGEENFTFGQLRTAKATNAHFKHLHVFALVSQAQEFVKDSSLVQAIAGLKDFFGVNPVEDFNSQDNKYNNVVIAAAVTASISIPFFLRATSLYYNKKNSLIDRRVTPLPGEEFVGTFSDCGGADQWNLPIHVFDTKFYSGRPLSSSESYTQFFDNQKLIGFSPYNYKETPKRDKRIVNINVSDVTFDTWLGLSQLEISTKIEKMIASGLTSTRQFLHGRFLL